MIGRLAPPVRTSQRTKETTRLAAGVGPEMLSPAGLTPVLISLFRRLSRPERPIDPRRDAHALKVLHPLRRPIREVVHNGAQTVVCGGDTA